ncbi:MAG: metalloregulator ArsR/SmtB family transcription factor [Robiginitomaculum sp.]
MKKPNESQVITALGSLSQQTRLRIVRYLVEKGESGASAGALAKAMDAAPSRLSFHLTNLTHSGLITSRRQSRHIIYQIDFNALGALMAYLLTDCCKGHPDIVAHCDMAGDGTGAKDCC